METPTSTDLEKLRYPIGRHQFNGLSPQQLAECLNTMETLPERLKNEVQRLSAAQLDTQYRPGGWTLRQVIHHFSDSHMNGLIRCKLALTEENPVIKPYNESAWAVLPDATATPVPLSLNLLGAVHGRWLIVLRSLSAADLQRTYQHPEYQKMFTLAELISLYAWHGEHHLAHITETKKRNGWA